MTDPVWNEITEADRLFFTAMAHGLLSARAKYPGNSLRYIALTGEAGEAFYAMEKLLKGTGTVPELAAELRQVAQMACRLAVEGDAMFAPDVQCFFPCVPWPTRRDIPARDPATPVLVE
jgi:hypothetical protein